MQFSGTIYKFGYRGSGGETINWEATLTWRDMFSLISPYLLKPPTDAAVAKIFSKIFYEKSNEYQREGVSTPQVNSEVFHTVRTQLEELGLIDVEYSETIQGGADLFWSLTKDGKEKMKELKSVKK